MKKYTQLLVYALFALFLHVQDAAGQVDCQTLGADTSDSDPTEIIGGNNSKSSWVQLVASSGIAGKLFYGVVKLDRNVAASSLTDFGTGAVLSEVVLIPDVFNETSLNSNNRVQVAGPFPIDVATSTRYAARVEGNSNFQVHFVQAVICSDRLPDLSSPTYTVYGESAGSSAKGTTIDPGASANTKGSWTEIAASVSSTAEWVLFHIGNLENIGMVDASWLFDIGTGAAASESAVIENLFLSADLASDQILPATYGPFPADWMQSERVSVRAQSNITDATDRLFSFTMTVVSGTVAGGGGGGGVIGGPNKRGGRQSMLLESLEPASGPVYITKGR